MSAFVSIIVPCRNERNFIETFIRDVYGQTWPQDRFEVIFGDGQSTDGTREYLEEQAAARSNLMVFENPARFVPQALNKAILRARGEVIVRMDVHSHYPPDYIEKLVHALEVFDADNTGGVWDTLPGAATDEARAIARATSHPFGIGNASYRLGASEPIAVDTVPYGCFRRSVFERYGMFDEDLSRNQDDEFNGRIIRNGGRIMLLPDVRIGYHARPNLTSMMKMFFQYGWFKPLVNLKLGAPATLRQFAPPFMVIASLLGILLLIPGWIPWSWVIFPASLYLLFTMVVSALISFSYGWSLLPWLVIVFPAIHVSYGTGYVRGIWDFYLMRKHVRGGTRVNDNR